MQQKNTIFVTIIIFVLQFLFFYVIIGIINKKSVYDFLRGASEEDIDGAVETFSKISGRDVGYNNVSVGWK